MNLRASHDIFNFFWCEIVLGIGPGRGGPRLSLTLYALNGFILLKIITNSILKFNHIGPVGSEQTVAQLGPIPNTSVKPSDKE